MRGGTVSHSTEGLTVAFSFARDMAILMIWVTVPCQHTRVPATAAGRAEHWITKGNVAARRISYQSSSTTAGIGVAKAEGGLPSACRRSSG
jgi:hypothetical protein